MTKLLETELKREYEILEKKKRELKNDQQKLNERVKVQNKNREATKALKKECDNGTSANKKESERLIAVGKIQASEKIALSNASELLDKREERTKTIEATARSMKHTAKEKLDELSVMKGWTEKEKKQLKEQGDKLEAFQRELVTLKAKYIKGQSDNEVKAFELKTTKRRLNERESSLVKTRADLDDRENKVSREESRLQIKDNYLAGKSSEVDQKIAEYFKLKRETTTLTIEVEELKSSVEKREAQSIEAQEVVEREKSDNSAEKKRLSAWSDELRVLEQDLKDRQKLLKIEDRELRKREEVIKKIRKEG